MLFLCFLLWHLADATLQKQLLRVPSYPSQQHLFFLLLLGVVLSLQETLDNCGLFLPVRMDSLFSPWLCWASSYPSLLPDSWRARPWAGSFASTPVCSGANAVGPRSGPWPGLPGMSAVQERFPKWLSPKPALVPVLHCWKCPLFSHPGSSFQLCSTLLLAFLNLALDFEAGCPAFSAAPRCG